MTLHPSARIRLAGVACSVLGRSAWLTLVLWLRRKAYAPMNVIGISTRIMVVIVFFFFAGGMLGEFIVAVFRGRASEWFSNGLGNLSCIGVVNLMGIACLVFVRKRSVGEPPMQRIERPLEILVRGLPVNHRIAFVLFSVAWVVGLVSGVVISI